MIKSPRGLPMIDRRFRFAGGAHDAFSREVQRLAAPILADPQRRKRGRRLLHAKAAAWAGLLTVSYGWLLAAPANGWVCLALAAIAAFAALMLAISAGHDAAHGVFLTSPRANRAVVIATFGLVGVDGNLWQRRHNGSHHAFPNVSGCDVDIDQNPVIRLSPHHARRPWQRWQHYYAPLAYGLVQLHSILIGDAIYLFRRRVANIIRERPAWPDVAIFAGTKAAYALLALGLPALALARPWWQVACGWLAISTLTSLTFVVLLIGTHFVEASAHPLAAADGLIAGSWAHHQLATSLDWHPDSRLANALSGGANAHAAHHLFPRVPHVHYVALTPIIRDVARRRGVPYNRASFAGMIASHFRFLHGLSRAPGCPPLATRSLMH
jgi:linoleoyl-CoA desaturase